MIRAIASQHIKWRRDHRAEWNRINVTGLCKCGRGKNVEGDIIDRGYMVGIECIHCA
jgi:hypothetical protein